MAELVYVDALTGLYNRAYLDITIRMIQEGTKRFEAAMMVDMDYFKDINDNFGHLVGDYVLGKSHRSFRRKFHSSMILPFVMAGMSTWYYCKMK